MGYMMEVSVKIRGLAPYSQSKPVQSVKEENEDYDAFDQRTAPEHLHVTADGLVFIPPMAIKHCISDAAAYASEKIKGGYRTTYTKHFKSGIMVVEPFTFDPKVHLKDVTYQRLFVPAGGKPGIGTRVYRTFPEIAAGWVASGTIYVTDPIIPLAKVAKYLEVGGRMKGLGRFRPENRGYYGRFELLECVAIKITKDDPLETAVVDESDEDSEETPATPRRRRRVG